jgi:hypothetical protein
MKFLIPLVLTTWPIVTVILTIIRGPRRGIPLAVLTGWLLLPSLGVQVQGFLDIDRRVSIALSVLISGVLLGRSQIAALRLKWFDLPILLLPVTPLLSSLSNGLGLYDGLTTSLYMALSWTVPWLTGRAFLSDPGAMRDFVRYVFVGGLLYAPLCIWEVRMSPSLHLNVYGDSPYFGYMAYAAELGKWGSRPSVFFKNPLELGMFMTCACLCGVAICLRKRRERLLGFDPIMLVAVLCIVALACKNLGATFLLAMGAATLWWVHQRGSLALLCVLTLLPASYAFSRTTGLWSGAQVTEVVSYLHEERAQSFGYRLRMEEILIEKALERPMLGWGGWGRSRVYNRWGDDISVVDGLWVDFLGKHGLLGLSLMIAAITVPAISTLYRRPRVVLRSDGILPVAVMLILLLLWGVDALVNGFTNTLILVGSGGAASIGSRTNLERNRIG